MNFQDKEFELLDRFLDAYEAITGIRMTLLQQEDYDPDTSALGVCQNLKLEIDSALQSQDNDENLLVALQRVRYALVALVDEQLICTTDWAGKNSWVNNLLEEHVYSTSLAGWELFRDIDRLIKRDSGLPYRAVLALIYLMVLQLGFRGELRDEEERLQPYFDKLQDLVDGQTDGVPPAVLEQAFEQAYLQNIEPGSQQRLAPLSRWITRIVLLTGVYLLASLAVWLGLLNDFRSLTEV
ncbi:DotU family type IV/VI secretion system protein [Gynuella sp.]|uniref:DotU family type IV/VI secretion system protein n=1 Tax=Gynuella sp. TaxID=2969146 RepID=UPI003D0C4CDD